MLLKEWMNFNKPYMSSDLQIVVLKSGSYNKNDTLLETTVNWDVAERFFGDYEMKKLTTGMRPNFESPCFRLIVWDNL